MEARDYCSALQTEIDGWRTKVYGMFGKFDRMPSDEKEGVAPVLSEIRAVIEEHTARMEKLSEQCPAGLGSQSHEAAHPRRLRKFWEELGQYRRYRIRL